MADECTAVESPCVRLCVIDAVTGCWRTLGEISFWARCTSEDRHRVMLCLEAHRAAACAATR